MTDNSQKEEPQYEALLVDASRLRKLRSRPRLPQYLRQLWQRRHFMKAEAHSKALRSGRGTFLGKTWIILDPLLQVMVYVVIFGIVLQVDRGIDNFVGFLTLGVLYFRFLTDGLSAGSGLIQSSRNMISSFSFPRASLAVSANLRQLIDNLPPAVIAITIALLTQLDKTPSWTVILVIPLYFLIHLFALGSTLIIARITAFIPDAKPLVSLLQRALFFVSGIFFSVERFESHPFLQNTMIANPFYQFLSAVRSCVLDGTVPNLGVWLYLLSWTFGLLIVGLIFFWHAEARYSSVK